jgi:hypothetical protein
MDSNWSFANGQYTKVIDYLQEMSGKSFENAQYSWDEENILVSLSDNKTILKINFDEFATDFTITEIKQNPNLGEGELTAE